ncbi:MAG: M23 family metallopeptidase [bacterium]|nr:M23 family metallopeptidase [bacterium]
MQAKIAGGLLIIGLVVLALTVLVKRVPQTQLPVNAPKQETALPASPENIKESTPSALVEPVSEFKQRITKKPFGIYITPNNSPVNPERFTGYHTAVDVEFDDVAGEVPVRAIADGKVLYSNLGSGYGGVMSVRHQIGTETITAVYGHLKPDSMLTVGTEVKKGQQLGILGQGYSDETDGERKHLHFGIHKGAEVNLHGYVATKEELVGWEDPQEVLN